jgi:hypothetical protein
MGRTFGGIFPVCACALAAGCSASADVLEDRPTGAVDPGRPPGDAFDPGGGDDGGFEECAGVGDEAKPLAVDMFIAADSSGSMVWDDNWGKARSAFTTFFTDPGADVLNVALRFWPYQGCDSKTCSAVTCSEPTVPLGSLADTSQEQALVQALEQKSPEGNTPMSAALAGATKFAVDDQSAKEGLARAVVVLMTDGSPNACEAEPSAIAKYAADAYDDADVPTFVVGIEGTSEALIDTIAAAGGTGKGYYISLGNIEAGLLAALKDIQENAIGCSFQMPVSEDPTKTVDPGQVNVTYTPKDGKPTTLPQVPGPEACGQKPGWYYDDPKAPTVIKLCPASCDFVGSLGEGARVDVVLGCATQIG